MPPPQFISALTPPTDHKELALWFIFAGNNLLVYENRDLGTVPIVKSLQEIGVSPLRQQFLGTLDGQLCYAVEVDRQSEAPAGMGFQNLRATFATMPEDFAYLAGRALQIVDWDRNHQFCGRCGAATVLQTSERARKCPSCGLPSYPRLSPSMIVRVRRGNEILLARGHQWPPGFYSVLAGFVEPGETVEDTVRREVREEVNIQVQNIRYFDSQPWPFPNSLMLGFTAEYAGGELQIDPDEIEDAAWFTVDNLPKMPPRFSIARRLIDDFVKEVEA